MRANGMEEKYVQVRRKWRIAILHRSYFELNVINQLLILLLFEIDKLLDFRFFHPPFPLRFKL